VPFVVYRQRKLQYYLLLYTIFLCAHRSGCGFNNPVFAGFYFVVTYHTIVIIMTRSVTILLIPAAVLVFSFFIALPENNPAQKVHMHYRTQCSQFIKAIKEFKQAVLSGDEKKMQQAFLNTRLAYKKTEAITEYFFSFYAAKLNGPPIPFFEEAEADVPANIPTGMQVIEGWLFPHYLSRNKKALLEQTDELLRYATELPAVTPSFAFSDATVLDAFMEELYRITALGITGFDSQTAQYALPECAAALQSLSAYSAFYKEGFTEKLPGQYDSLQYFFTQARLYIEHNNRFNHFNRAVFITEYMNPLARLTGAFKTANDLKDNPAGQYYSAVLKNNSLFAAGAFNPYRFLDDFDTSAAKTEMGRQLFFDTQLSADNSRSCATCHQPGKAFTDGLKTSIALDGHTALPRNAPTLWNAALQRNLFADSRSRNLEEQVMQVLNNAKEMHGTAQQAAEKIIAQQKYKTIYAAAYPNSKMADAAQNICNAIACYERTLIALNSRFDKHMNGQPALTAAEINGFNLFMGKAKCGTCHFMPLFGGAKPPRYYYTESEVVGVPATSTKKNAQLDDDSGRYLFTGYPIHLYSFKTPTIRNTALTAPYMHNGVFNTLEEVVDFYNEGGGQGLGIAPGNQSLPFEKLQLSAAEKKNIVAFMKALTDTSPVY
jgi:cytochrome c peroxidase